MSQKLIPQAFYVINVLRGGVHCISQNELPEFTCVATISDPMASPISTDSTPCNHHVDIPDVEGSTVLHHHVNDFIPHHDMAIEGAVGCLVRGKIKDNPTPQP